MMKTYASRIFLVGLMGAGKSSVGRLLADRLKYAFIDSDQEIEARSGVKIPLIFEMEGEAGFRRREKIALEELSQRSAIVLATGGGAVLDADSRQILRERGFVVYLKASPEVLFQRTMRDRHRPLLQTDDPRKVLEELLIKREPYYLEVAHLVINSECYLKEVVQAVLTEMAAESE